MTSPWQQKRAQIAQTMRGAVAPGGLSLGNGGATFRANPMMAPSAAAGPGLMGQAGGGGQMARMAQMPGFNYVPPPTGPAPVAAPAAGAPMPWTRDDKLAFMRGRQTPANAMAYTQALGQGAYNYNPGGSGNNRYRR
jgi:hypothetical protein